MTRRVIVSLEEDVAVAAEQAGVDLSDVLSRALRRSLPQLQDKERAASDEEWRKENREAIEAINRFIDEHGLFSDGIRMF
jgi:antitoxin CcdA